MAFDIHLIPKSEFDRVLGSDRPQFEKLSLFADMCRANTLAAVKRAGSGHLGSSFSAMDIVVWLYLGEMNTLEVGFDSPDRDVYFSSKGHDVPGLYSVLFALGALPAEKLMSLRRFGGLDGHPDTKIRGIEANSGSLGMGISKGKGIAWAKRYNKRGGRVFVMTGDGELQEGQNYEALMTTVQQKVDNLTVIVDHNKLQSDKTIREIVDLGNLEEKFRSFGWEVERIDGHDFASLQRALGKGERTAPKIVIADTIKGRGISFMEHPAALEAGKGLYPWHAGAPDDTSFKRGHDELLERIRAKYSQFGLGDLRIDFVEPENKPAATVKQSLEGEPLSLAAPRDGESLEGEPLSLAAKPTAASVTDEYVAKEYGRALVELGATRKDLIVIDADLSADCRIRDFENTYPEQFIENGIAEQDMVSTAAGLARHGLLPVVNSFASFLASRANEQIYNAATENSKIIYVSTFGGLIPAGPGKSHQSIRDISLFGALPNVTMIQPANGWEAREATRYVVNDAKESCVLRLAIGPSPRKIEFDPAYRFTEGRGVALTQGEELLVFAYGPVLLHEVLLATEGLASRGTRITVINMPWLNRADRDWLGGVVARFDRIAVVDDHSPVGGLGDFLLATLADMRLLNGRTFVKIGVEGYPACGTPSQALRHHRLDGESLAERFAELAAQKVAPVAAGETAAAR